MKKSFLKWALTLVLCCTCALLVTGCEEYDKWQTLEVGGADSVSCNVYSAESGKSFQEWTNELFASTTFTYTNTRNEEENFSCTGLAEFRKLGGRLSFNPNSAGEHTATFSYAGANCEITITVS